jgi:SAM-dependent methyltransferase
MTATDTTLHHCRICGNASCNQAFTVREMMFGSKEPFEYFECRACGAMQISTIPADLARHYPAGYYAFNNQAREKYSPFERVLKRARARHAIEGKGLLGALVARVQGAWPYFDWFRAARVSFDARILDVGCGRGDYLLRFASDGFKYLTGVDPYIEADLQYDNGVKIHRCTLEWMTGEFDCIFSRHSFEHVPEPRTALREMARLARVGGALLIAVPVAGSWAWEEYGTHWFQLDAPRHIVVPSRRSMELLAGEFGLTLEHVLFDSTPEQMIASELYRRGISLMEYFKKGPLPFFRQAELDAFRKKAAELNAEGRGDQACFILRKGSAG